MLILKANKDGKEYVVEGRNLKIKLPEGCWDEAVSLDDIKVYENGELITDFGENFVGQRFGELDAAASLILGYVNNDTTIEDMQIAASLAGFRDRFVCDNRLELDEGATERVIPKKYITPEKLLNIELVTKSGEAFYSDGDTCVMVRADGSLATDMEVFYTNAFYEAIEKEDYQYLAEGINPADILDEED